MHHIFFVFEINLEKIILKYISIYIIHIIITYINIGHIYIIILRITCIHFNHAHRPWIVLNYIALLSENQFYLLSLALELK